MQYILTKEEYSALKPISELEKEMAAADRSKLKLEIALEYFKNGGKCYKNYIPGSFSGYCDDCKISSLNNNGMRICKTESYSK